MIGSKGTPPKSSPTATPQRAERSSRGLTPRAEEVGRNLVAAFFMGVRTAQIHSPSNQAFDNALRALHGAAEVVFTETGPFTVQFVEEHAYLNNARLRFEGSGMTAMRLLSNLLATEGIGGFQIDTLPSAYTMKKLMLLFASASSGNKVSRSDFGPTELGLLGPQQFGDARELTVDSVRLALQLYAKLILALHEQYERTAREGEADTAPPQFRAVRIVQDVIDLSAERPDLIVRLAMNRIGAPPHELRAVNATLLSIAMGRVLGLQRSDLADMGVGALFHMLGNPEEWPETDRNTITRDGTRGALARLLSQSGVGSSTYRRALVIAEHRLPAGKRATGDHEKQPHTFARIAGVAVAFTELVGGYSPDSAAPLEPLDALSMLISDTTGRYDPHVVDLLVNVLRAFPIGVGVLLDTGEQAVVTRHLRPPEWDRPEVMPISDPMRRIDLRRKAGGVWARTITSTMSYAGFDSAPALLEQFALRPIPTSDDVPLTREVPEAEGPGALPRLSTSDLTELTEIKSEPEIPFEEVEDLHPAMRHPSSDPPGNAPPPPRASQVAPTLPSVPPEGVDLLRGDMIADRYRILEKIGQGGMASVYRVEHTLLAKTMAMKLLDPEAALMPQAAERFLREARSACRLDDPNIVRVTDLGMAQNGRPYLVMELLQGVTLAQMTRTPERMPLIQMIDIVDQILSGLSHAHLNQIVHRDIKPDNVMLISKGGVLQVKILDFGIAKFGLDPSDSHKKGLTRPGMVFGTLHYMSPEQALGESVDFRSDLYSTGVILYELLAGRCPFEGEDGAVRILARTISQPPPPIDLSAYQPQLATMLSRVVLCALAKEREERFGSANAFRNALRACLPLIPR